MPDLFDAVRAATAQLVGAYAIAVVREGDARIIVARHGAPLLIGVGRTGAMRHPMPRPCCR